MTTLDDWPRVKRVLAGALACEGAGRQSYLAEACGTDAELRARVDRLLAAGDRAGTFLEMPAARLLEPNPREDLSGRVAGSYQLVSRLGAGGMGEVYLAHDAKLDRPVALKFLSLETAGDRDRLRRFHQEARAGSSLNHPHIVVVHDFGELDGRPYMVTEFIEGETLRQRLQRGALPMPSGSQSSRARGHRLKAPTWNRARNRGWYWALRATCRRSRRVASTWTHAATSGVSASCCTKWPPAAFPSPKTAP
jgi:hypothetical protein